MGFALPRFPLLTLLVLVFVTTACGDKTRRDFAVCNTNPCQVGYVCLNHQCVKGDGGEDPSTRYPGWDSDGGADIPVATDADAGKPDAGQIDRPIEVPSTCSNDNQCPISTPTCLASHCSKCGSDTDCSGHPGPACNIASGICVQCTAAARHCTTDPGKGFCVANTCTGCQAAGTNACTGSTPVCDATSGACVQCTGSAQCTADTGKAFCVAKACVGCQAAGAGACKGSTPVCDATSGACVQCTTALQCAADTTKAFCVAKACAGCAAAGGNSACASRGGGTPVCATSGLCVECVTSADCTGDVTRPICDTGTNKCVPCATDAQCAAKGGGPGVCMFHDNRRCASDAETVYVENKTGCAAGGAAGGTAAMPFCQPQPGIDDAVVVGSGKRLVLIRGTVFGWSASSSAGTMLSVVGQSNAVVAGGAARGIDITGGDFYLRNLVISASVDVGVAAGPAATVRMDRCTVKANMKGGLLVSTGGAFDIANSVFDSNGPGFAAGVGSFGGVALGAGRAGGPSRFWYNTVIANKQVGVVCEQATQSMAGSLLYQNIGGDVVNCTVTSSKQTSDGDPKLTADYHLTASSPCRDAGDPVSFPLDDIDGDSRPQGARSDCGADEFKP